ncbi:GTPase IMAP family member 8-like [Pimephales promelas]|uniref:GTPase IMAP family member 8-like n=1 Tax=Pimephales promelas TaxID=90988 RepID=UPI0019555C52|nr:GTPase IMAP family member 8-like [Pimephales promelas]
MSDLLFSYVECLNVFLCVSVSDLRIVLLGKNVSENSGVGNFILGRAAFDSEAPPDVVERVGGRLKDIHVTIINSPQLLQTHLSLHHVTHTVRECVNLSDPGPHVFILVLQNNDITEEDRYRVKTVLREFSEEAIKRTIVLTTDEDTHDAKGAPVTVKKVIQQLNAECGGGHLQLEHATEEWCSIISQRIEKILRENSEEFLTCELYDYAEGSSVDEDHNRSFASLGTEEEDEESDADDDGKYLETRTEKKKAKGFIRNIPLMSYFSNPETRPEHYPAKRNVRVSRKKKLCVVLCGSDGRLKASVSRLIRGKNKFFPPLHLKEKECVRRNLELHGRVVSLVKLPAVNRLSEEEVMRNTLRCVSLCDPGVHVFLFIVPDAPLTDEDKAEMEEIQRIFGSSIKNHLMVLIIQEKSMISKLIGSKSLCNTSATETSLKTFGGHRFVLENSSQVPALLQDVDNMVEENRGSCYTTFMYLQARVELEKNKHRAEIGELRRSMMKTQSGMSS